MEEQARYFVRNWALACVGVTMLLALVNVIVDPYLLFQMPRVAGFNARKPGVETHERMMKTYEVVRVAPKTVLLGTSRVTYSLDAQHTAWPMDARPVYNLGVAGGGPYTSYRLLQHLMAHHAPTMVVLALDFDYFQGTAEPQERPHFEARLAVTRDNAPNPDQTWQQTRDLLQVFSLDTLLDSVATLRANVTGDSYDLVNGTVATPQGEWRRVTANGSLPPIAYNNLHTIEAWRRFSAENGINPRVIQYVRSILDLCESHGTDVIVLINPMHAHLLEIVDRAGAWSTLEQWKREITTLVATYAGTDRLNRVVLWDFNGYDSFATEPVVMNRRALRYYWEPVHYSKELGDVIISRILGAGAVRFGSELTPDNIDAHLATIREQQRRYREQYVADVQHVADLHRAIVGVQPTQVVQGH